MLMITICNRCLSTPVDLAEVRSWAADETVSSLWVILRLGNCSAERAVDQQLGVALMH